MGLAFGADTPRYWCDNDPVLTHFLNALSLSFPEGERFFVKAVRNFRDRVEDPQRQTDISGFIGQEAMHSLEHPSFKGFLDSLGYGEITRSGEGMARGLWKLLGPDGIVTRIVPDFMEFFSKDSHPWQQENSHLIKQWRAELERLGQAGTVA